MIKPEDVIQFAIAIARYKTHLESQVKHYSYLSEKLTDNQEHFYKAKIYRNSLEEFNLIIGGIE